MLMFVIKPNQNNILHEIKEFVFLSFVLSRVSAGIFLKLPLLDAAEGRKGKIKPHTALFTAAVSRFCLVSNHRPWKGLNGGRSPIIFITEEEQISLVLSHFHINMSGETEEKHEGFRRESKTALDCFPWPPLIL